LTTQLPTFHPEQPRDTIDTFKASETWNERSSLYIYSNPLTKYAIIMSTQQSRSHNTSRMSTIPSQKPRQLSHLHSQLAQLTAHVSDLEQLLRMTAVQAESMRSLGGYAGAMYVSQQESW
jgi:hypothetical protein